MFGPSFGLRPRACLAIVATVAAALAAGCSSVSSWTHQGPSPAEPSTTALSAASVAPAPPSAVILAAHQDISRPTGPILPPDRGAWQPAEAARAAVNPPTAPGQGNPQAPQALPIDLPTALRLGNAENLRIALARERINAAFARLKGAEVLWLPNARIDSQYLWHNGQIQQTPGDIITTRRSSLYVWGGPVLSVDLADAIYEPLVARQGLRAEQAAAAATTNDTLLRVAEVYLDLLAAQASVAIADETQGHAAELARITGKFAQEGAGLPSDAARAQTELGSRQQQVVLAREQLVISSAELARLLRLDPQLQLTPMEPSVVPIEVVPDGQPLPQLVADALTNRPELAEQRALVQLSVQRLRQATYGPLIPSVLVGYQAGGFGGGRGNFFGDFDRREDLTAVASWELHNLGLGDLSLHRLRQSQLSQAQIRSLEIADRVAAEVVSAYQIVQSRHQQVQVAQRTVEAALRSYNLNLTRIRGGAGLPIEVLQSIQALDRARLDYLQAVTSYDKGQFRLLTALGNTPIAPAEAVQPPEGVQPPERPSAPAEPKKPSGVRS